MHILCFVQPLLWNINSKTSDIQIINMIKINIIKTEIHCEDEKTFRQYL